MLRPSVSRPLRRVALTGAAACAATVPLAAGAHGATSAAAASRACTGSWELQVSDEPGAPPIHGLASFHADGTAVYGETSAITSLTPGVRVEYTSPGLGGWTPAAGGCRYHFVVYAADATGAYRRRSDITGTVKLDGRRFTGPVIIKVSHPDAAGMTIRTRASGSRIAP